MKPSHQHETRVCLDSSVWIEFFRSGKHNEMQKSLVDQVLKLIDEDRLELLGPIKLEILTGLQKRESAAVLDAFKAFQEVIPDREDYELCYERTALARQKGITLGGTDLLIATLCSRRDWTLWSLDRDFKQMEKLGFVQLLQD